MKKYIFGLILALTSVMGIWFAQEYTLFYGNGCPHCAEVEQYFEDANILKTFDVQEKEVFYNKKNLTEFNGYLKKHNLTYDRIGVPFLIITSGENCDYINGSAHIIAYFSGQLAQQLAACTDTTLSGASTNIDNQSWKQRLSFLGIMMPAAVSDSINPCAFAVMFLLLSTILSKYKSRRKTLLSGLIFAGAIFITYLAMGVGLFSALANATNTTVLKIIVGVIGILVWLANVKDYFRYGKWFVMEVPFSWRPKMMAVIESVSSYWGVFIVGVLISLFLLPCSSGPYFTILGYMSSETKNLHLRGYIYLIIYNLIFVLPMVIIAGLVGFGYASVDSLAKIKHNNTKLIHLIVGILMLGLGAYVLWTL